MRLRPFLARERFAKAHADWLDAPLDGCMRERQQTPVQEKKLPPYQPQPRYPTRIRKRRKISQGALNAVIRESSLHFKKSRPPIEYCSGNIFLPGPGSHSGHTCS